MIGRRGMLGYAVAASVLPPRLLAAPAPVPVIDTLAIDGPDADFAAQLAAGMSGAVVDLRIYPRGPIEAKGELDAWTAAAARPGAGFAVVRRAADFAAARDAGRFAVVLACQDAAILGPSVFSVGDGNIDWLTAFHGQGLRVLQLTHNERNGVGDSFRERTDAGLSRLGEAVVAAMNRLGLLVDLSHCSDATTMQAVALSSRPVAVTHAGCRALLASLRNKPDAVIRALADKGGYFGVYQMSRWLTARASSSVENVVDHIDHVVKIGGIATAGFGSDQPLAGDPEPQAGKVANLARYQARNAGLPGAEPLHGHVTCADLDNPRRLGVLAAALTRRGYKGAEVEAITGGNFVRVFAAACG